MCPQLNREITAKQVIVIILLGNKIGPKPDMITKTEMARKRAKPGSPVRHTLKVPDKMESCRDCPSPKDV